MRKSLKYVIVSFFYLIIFSSELLAETSPSFDCAKATTEVEKLICSDDELAKLDVEMNKWYKKALRWTLVIGGGYDVARANQKWLQRRNNYECRPKLEDKKECMISLHKEAIQVWKNVLLAYELPRACKFIIYEDSSYVRDENAKCNFGYIDKLLKEGADLNGYVDFNDECYKRGPVYFNAMWNGRKEVFDYAVKHGADFKAPLRKACRDRGITQALDGPNAVIYIDEIMKLNPNTDLNKWKYWKDCLPTALFYKQSDIAKKNHKFLQKLVSYGANVNITNENGDNILSFMFAYPTGNKNFPFDYEATLNMLNYLIEHGINVSHKNNDGHDALYYLQHSPYSFEQSYYEKFEKLLTPKK